MHVDNALNRIYTVHWHAVAEVHIVMPPGAWGQQGATVRHPLTIANALLVI